MAIVYTGVNGGSFINSLTGPSPGDLVTANSIGVGLAQAANNLKYMYDTKANLADPTFTGLVTLDELLVGGVAQFDDEVALGDDLSVGGVASFNGAIEHNSTDRWLDPVRPADANPINIAASQGDIFLLATPSAAVPGNVVVANGVEGDRVRIQCFPDALGSSDGKAFVIKRADTTVIAELYICTVKVSAADRLMASAVIIQVDGGVWRGVGLAGIVDKGAGW